LDEIYGRYYYHVNSDNHVLDSDNDDDNDDGEFNNNNNNGGKTPKKALQKGDKKLKDQHHEDDSLRAIPSTLQPHNVYDLYLVQKQQHLQLPPQLSHLGISAKLLNKHSKYALLSSQNSSNGNNNHNNNDNNGNSSNNSSISSNPITHSSVYSSQLSKEKLNQHLTHLNQSLQSISVDFDIDSVWGDERDLMVLTPQQTHATTNNLTSVFTHYISYNFFVLNTIVAPLHESNEFYFQQKPPSSNTTTLPQLIKNDKIGNNNKNETSVFYSHINKRPGNRFVYNHNNNRSIFRNLQVTNTLTTEQYRQLYHSKRRSGNNNDHIKEVNNQHNIDISEYHYTIPFLPRPQVKNQKNNDDKNTLNGANNNNKTSLIEPTPPLQRYGYEDMILTPIERFCSAQYLRFLETLLFEATLGMRDAHTPIAIILETLHLIMDCPFVNVPIWERVYLEYSVYKTLSGLEQLDKQLEQ